MADETFEGSELDAGLSVGEKLSALQDSSSTITPSSIGGPKPEANVSCEGYVGAAARLAQSDEQQVDARPGPVPEVSRPVEKDSLVKTYRDSPYYDISGPKKVIIFNHKKFATRFQLNERKGTELDVFAIEKTFESLDWQVEIHNDASASDIRGVISLLQVREETEKLHALAIFILSHGEDNGTVFAADSMYRVDHDILNALAADKCPYLAGKPKLIFVQACQGQATDPGARIRRRHTSQDSTATYKIPNYADFLIYQASFWNHYSFRSSDTGSWFIQALCTKLKESSDQDNVLDILTLVSRSVAIEKESNVPNKPSLHQKKQIPLCYSTLLRKIYLKGTPSQSPGPCDSPVIVQNPSRLELPDHSRLGKKDNCICM